LWVLAHSWNAETHACDMLINEGNREGGKIIPFNVDHEEGRSEAVNTTTFSTFISNRDACADAVHGHGPFPEQVVALLCRARRIG